MYIHNLKVYNFYYFNINVLFQIVFKMYDKESKGYINGFELRQALNTAGYHLNTHILNIMCHRYATKDGNIMFDDFIMCAVRLKTMIGQYNLDFNS